MNSWGFSGRFSQRELISNLETNTVTNQCVGPDSIYYRYPSTFSPGTTLLFTHDFKFAGRPHYAFVPILSGCVDPCSPVEPYGFSTDLPIPTICTEQQFSTSGCYREWSLLEPTSSVRALLLTLRHGLCFLPAFSRNVNPKALTAIGLIAHNLD